MAVFSHEADLIIMSALTISIAIGFTRAQPFFVRRVAIGFVLVCFPLLFLSPDFDLGRAKPLGQEFGYGFVNQAAVISVTMVENQKIYVTLIWAKEPELYSIPWDQKTAQSLTEVAALASRLGTQVIMRSPFAANWNGAEPRFYVLAPTRARSIDHPPGTIAPGDGMSRGI